MRFFSADVIFPVGKDPIYNGVLVTNSEGKIKDLVSKKEIDPLKIEYYRGFICPGFINTHCHLELSYLKGKILPKKGIASFLSELTLKRDLFKEEKVLASIKEGDNEMREQGIVACGDIANSSITLDQKKRSPIQYHTFIEVFGLDPCQSQSILEKAIKLKDLHTKKKMLASIVPHSAYTLSESLFSLLKNIKRNSPLSIHNQEGAAEKELFKSGKGSLNKFLSKYGKTPCYNKQSSPEYITQYLKQSSKVLFVHNTFSRKKDIAYVEKNISYPYWCTCPKANFYIEERIPDYEIFIKEGVKLTVGTDSLASNNTLSILEELKTIQEYKKIKLNTLLRWATLNGAEALGLKKIGQLKKDFKPGVNLIENVNIRDFSLTKKSKIKVLI